MIVAGIDFETTSVDPHTCHPTEVAFILWEPETRKIVESTSLLIKVPEEITNSEITGIDNALVEQYGWKLQDVTKLLVDVLCDAHYLMAHNVDFDRTILKRVVSWDDYIDEKPFTDKWIDTITDIPYPPQIKTRSLSYLAAEHGFVNPFPHRALFDVATMIQLVSMYDFMEILEYAHSPNIWLRASVSFDDKQLAKDRHFRWDPENKFWVKQVKELNIAYEEERANFPIDLLPGYVYKEQYL